MSDGDAKTKRAKRSPRPPYQTALERHPEYLRAIGTVAVEMTNMEVMLADLLSAILGLPDDTAHAIYFAAQATGPRLTLLANASQEALKQFPNYAAKVADYMRHARKYSNQRNDIMHDSWGLSEEKMQVSRRKTPLHKSPPAKQIPVENVKELIHNIRVLVTDVIYLVDQIDNDPTYIPSLRKSREQTAPDHPNLGTPRQTPRKARARRPPPS